VGYFLDKTARFSKEVQSSRSVSRPDSKEIKAAKGLHRIIKCGDNYNLYSRLSLSLFSFLFA
ncbi:MAG TPA: hypothetical protein QF700_01955, partial [Prochlorococcus sp.]|nr:hypothetical protein [Prochlorococcus sp.]